MSITIKNLTVKLGDSITLKNLNININEGELIAILGPNGAGKTTLLKTILRLLEPVTGVIYINEWDISKLSVREHAKVVSYVPQEHVQTFPYRVVDIVVMGLCPYISIVASPSDSHYDEALTVLENLGIRHLANRPYVTLSGGERRLVLIARALMQKPKIMLLDEPTVNLDLHNKVKILSILSKLSRSKRITIIFSTHDPNEALAVADRIIIIHKGSIMFDGKVSDITAELLRTVYDVNIKIITEESKRYVVVQI